MRLPLPLLSLGVLAACGQPAQPTATPTPTPAAANGYAARVAALPARLRAGVLLRAIRDAGQPCQQVVGAEQAAGTSAPAPWVATCDDHGRWVVAIADDGTATVVDAKDVARHP